MTARDKLFFWLFQSQPDRILQLLPELPTDAGGYRFVAPVFKALEPRPNGLFLEARDGGPLPAGPGAGGPDATRSAFPSAP